MSYKNYINSNTVILLGNGINRLNKDENHISWESILKGLSMNNNNLDVPKGYPLTEFFEIINIDRDDTIGMKNEFINSIRRIRPNSAHYDLISTCKNNGTNILTTNFDHALQNTDSFIKGADRKLKKEFSNHYPWQRYYYIDNEPKSIKIWHVNGDYEYSNSIKLSVSDYAGCINYFEKFDPSTKKSEYYNDRTWINEIMEKDLIVVGLSLSEAEIFLRHILIKRFLFSRKNRIKSKGYFLTTKGSDVSHDAKLRYFLKSVGIEMIDKYLDYEEIYF